MPKPVCVACRCFYRPEKNGFFLVEGKPDNNTQDLSPDEYRGTRHPEVWSPYKLWIGDMWECPECHHQIVVGFAGQPISQDYLPGFEEKIEACGNPIQINDC